MNYFSMILAITITLLTVLYILLYLQYENLYKYWKLKNVPFKKPEYFIGNILGVIFGKYSSSTYITKLCNEFDGPYFVFFLFNKPFLVVKDPKIIKRILVTDFQQFSGKILLNDKDVDPVFSNSVFSLTNPLWKSIRTRISKVFSPFKVKAMMTIAQTCGDRLTTYLENRLDRPINVKDVTIRYSTEVISNCVFGINFNCFSEEDNVFAQYAHNIFPKAFAGTLKGFTYIFLPHLVTMFKYPFLDGGSCEFFYQIFSEFVEQKQSLTVKRNDLLDILLDLQKEDTEGAIFNKSRVLAQAISFLAVGHETLSSIVALTMFQLSLNETIQIRLRDEINDVIDRYGDINSEALEDMKYMQMVIFESLRMYPVIQFIQRKSIEDCVIPETGLVLEKGTPVIVPTHWLHFNETYFPEPYKYNPERFSEENKHIIDPYAFLPFSAGPRNCLGKRFALMNLKVSIVAFVRNFRIEPVPGLKKVVFGSSHSLEPQGDITVKFSKL